MFNKPFRRFSLSRAWLLVSFQRSPARFTSRPKNSGLLGFWVSAVPLSRIAWNTFLFLSSWSMTLGKKRASEVERSFETKLDWSLESKISPCPSPAFTQSVSKSGFWSVATYPGFPTGSPSTVSPPNSALLRTSATFYNRYSEFDNWLRQFLQFFFKIFH